MLPNWILYTCVVCLLIMWAISAFYWISKLGGANPPPNGGTIIFQGIFGVLPIMIILGRALLWW